MKIPAIIKVLLIPVLYALALRLFFGIKRWDEMFEVMSWSFLFCLPFIVGALTIYFSTVESRMKWYYRAFMPWIPIFIFFFITLIINIEGWACWIMILPLFLIGASIGGFIMGYFLQRKKNDKVYVSALVLVPFLFSPLEHYIGANQKTYRAVTSIEINAPAEKIWRNVTRVQEINKEQDKGWLNHFLGFPRPVKAELNYEGIGAYREAIFTNGLVFHETVYEYEKNKKMMFSIKAYPYEIPSTTLDEHIVVGGKFFNVLNGTYELEKIGTDKYCLHLYSNFQLNTTFNFYAGWWSKWIMKDIQNNILKIQKERAEM